MGITPSFRAEEGIKGHKEVQKSRGEEGYKAEVPLSTTVETGHVILEISGRVDGILHNGEKIVLEEIKTIEANPADIKEDSFPIHWAQARVYGYMLATNEPEAPLEEVDLKLIYYNVKTKKSGEFVQTHSLEDLREFFNFLSEIYSDWLESINFRNREKNLSIKKLEFPFSSYRTGQRKMAVAVFRAIRDGEKLFVQAPTGIGKTLAVLFPAIKALREEHTTKIFYLTARTIARTVAEDSLDIFRETGLHIKSVTITAKQKICFLKDRFQKGGRPPCKPELCPYAKGHYSRVRKALEDIMSEEGITRKVVERYAEKHRVCPFELSLDVALWVDIIICDYNYVFDPRARLKRFFQCRKESLTFLIDESHNLPERAREMFSAELYKKEVLSLKRKLKETDSDLCVLLGKINAELLALRKKILGPEKNNREGAITSRTAPLNLGTLVKEFVKNLEWKFKWKKKSAFPDELFDFYYSALVFSKTLDIYNEQYVTFAEATKRDFIIKLYCVDPSILLAEVLKKGKAAIFFSATLSPSSYYISLSGGDEDSRSLVLSSPFPGENLMVLIDGRISTRFKDRERSYDTIANHIQRLIKGRAGNYLVFFPSFAYLREVLNRFSALTGESAPVTLIYQEPGMNEEERETFLNRFTYSEGKSLVGFAVMGGIFGEGIDLKGKRLSGAVIVGVGLPQIGRERDVIREYYNEKGLSGFEYAYMYPGLNRVLQAAGRVIRGEKDTGVIFLIDDRFLSYRYKPLLPAEWRPVPVSDPVKLKEDLRLFAEWELFLPNLQ